VITSGVGVGEGRSVSVEGGVLVGGAVGGSVGGGDVLVGVGAINVKRTLASSPEREPRAITSAHAAPIQRISLGKVNAV
jgi:hypothetical protein